MLEAVAELDYEGNLGVIVVDNDAVAREGEAVCREMAPEYRWPLRHAIEEQRGISYARNRSVAMALEDEPDFIAMLDDDEWPTRGWLKELLRVQAETDADVVGGPMFAEFAVPPPDWMRRGGFFDRDLRRPDGAVARIECTANFLARADCFRILMPHPFALQFALSGGSDTVFFRSLAWRGFAMRWAANATVYETVPPSRMTLAWLRQRQFRTGNVLLAIHQIFTPGAVHEAVRALKTVAFIMAGALLFCIAWPSPIWRTRSILMVCKGLGILSRYGGRTVLEYTVIHGS